jgi:hypothetical protein
MKSRILFSLLVTSALVAPAAFAAPVLIARGELDGSTAGLNADLSGLTGTLENGVPANLLGGLGSGLAYAGGDTFVAVPDRGPNAKTYNAAVDNTASFIARTQTLTMSLTQGAPGDPLPFKLTPTLTATTLLSSATPLAYGTGAGLGNKIDGVTPIGSGAPAQNTANTFFFTGRSDNFDPTKSSGNPNNARLDPESIRVSNDGKSVFISDEYGPYVYQFDRATGQRIKSFTLPNDPAKPGNLDVSNLSPVGSTEISGNTTGRVANKGMEGLAITPDGKTLVGIIQAPLIQDVAAGANNLLRIVTIDIATGKTKEFAYLLTTGSGVSDIVAVNDHQFLVDERDGKGLGDGSKAKIKQVFEIDLNNAVDISDLTGGVAVTKAVSKKLFLDIVATLNVPGGITDPAQIPAKIEGLAFGQDVDLGGGKIEHTLYVSNDNDFVPDSSFADPNAPIAGPNQFFVFGFSDTDLAGFEQQQLPEPATLALLVPGILALWRRRSIARG